MPDLDLLSPIPIVFPFGVCDDDCGGGGGGPDDATDAVSSSGPFCVFFAISIASRCNLCFRVDLSAYASKDGADRYKETSSCFTICGSLLSHSCEEFLSRCFSN